jgi:pimeloyl-ACP methyl ester carboxylesterase
MTIFVSLVLLLAAPSFAAASGPSDACGKEKIEGVEYGYCLRAATKGNPDVLYYLHGGGSDEFQWQKGLGKEFKQEWSNRRTGSPAVITFSFGPSWLLGDVNTPGHPALLPLVREKLMPLLEAKLGGVRGRRFVMGPSMGGYNSAELGLRHPELFAAILPLCPGMLTLTLSSSPTDIDAFLVANSPKIQRTLVERMLAWVKHDFLTQENWDRHDPLLLAAKATPQGPRVYVHSTFDDDYGFYPAAQKFAELLKARGVPTKATFHSEGRHCSKLDEAAVAEMVEVMK